MSFENQNSRAKIRLEMSDGVLLEVPLAVVVRAIQEQHMRYRGEDMRYREKDLAHWAFSDFYADDPRAMVHLVVAEKKDALAVVEAIRSVGR